MAPLTQGRPKELLSLGRRSILERVIDEGIRAGADETIVVSSARKPEIEAAITEWNRGPFREARVRVVEQAEMRGLGDAVLGTCDVSDEVLVLLGDCVYFGESPAERMASLVYRGVDGCIAVESVSDDEVSRYGICEVDEMGTIRGILEKPQPDETSSRWAVAARYAFGAPAFAAMRHWFPCERERRSSGEISLTAGIQHAIREGFELKAVALHGTQERLDCGTPEEYLQTRGRPWD